MSAPEPAPVGPVFIPASHERSRRRLMVVLSAVLSIIVVAAIVLSRSTSAEPGTHDTAPSVAPMPADADVLSQRAMTTLESALHESDRDAFLAAWDDSASSQRQAAVLYDNLTALRARIDLDVIVATAHLVDVSAGDGAFGWDADVAVSWGLRGLDRGDATTRMLVHFDESSDGAGIVDISRADSTPQPIWLIGPLIVLRDADTLTAASDAHLAQQVERGLNLAQHDLADAGVHWRGTLVAFVPPGLRDFERIVDASRGRYDNIAGIDASVGTSVGEDSPQMIAINPSVFAGLTARGRRVVITHEATHFATAAAQSAGPMWLVEGYADYVALSAADIPIHVGARLALADVTRSGAPAHLPTTADFSEPDPGRQQLAYERSWLVVKTIAARYGQRRLTHLYRAVVSDGVGITRALHAQLSTTVPALTRTWRESLENLAHAG